MRTLEQYLLVRALADQTIKEWVVRSISIDDSSQPWLLYEPADKDSKVKPKKLNLSKVMWADLATMYETYIWSDMVANGYVMTPIEGGWIVVSPTGEDYQLSIDSCTCPHFLHGLNKVGRCKHLVFRDAELKYRTRQCDLAAKYQV